VKSVTTGPAAASRRVIFGAAGAPIHGFTLCPTKYRRAEASNPRTISNESGHQGDFNASFGFGRNRYLSIMTQPPRHARPLVDFPNLGPCSAEMLAKAEITSVGDLRDLGPVASFLAVRQTGQNPSLNLLWAIAAGLQNRHWTSLTEAEKAGLRDQLREMTR